MKKELSYIKKGFSLVEILIAISVFLIFVMSFFAILTNSISQITQAGNREKAVTLAEEGLEAVRNIREDSFENLIEGNYGLIILNNEFNFSNSNDITDIFTREIIISTLEDDFLIKQVESKVFWDNKSVSLITYFTNWQEIIEDEVIETCQDYCIVIGYLDGICRQNPRQCQLNNEIYEQEGDEFCPGPPQRDCCCQE